MLGENYQQDGDRPSILSIQNLIDIATEFGDLTGLLSLPLHPLVVLSAVPLVHADRRALTEYYAGIADQNQINRLWTKRIPGMLLPIPINDPEEGGIDVQFVVDFATGLMWQSVCGHQVTYSDALESAEAVKHRTFAGTRGWRIPTLHEAISLLPYSMESYSSYPKKSPFSMFGRWESVIWTSDRLKSQSQGVACLFYDRMLACPQDYASVRFVRTI
jgi:hypothetical protein